ncbi:alpha/beta fold hydrolase [candidate division KSB1 bacterium]|nr:alpha/beta fold hydrolase [candidate division KSB1 bacterium]
MKYILYLIFSYLVIAVFAFFWQRRLIYYPDKQKPQKTRLDDAGLALWPAQNGYRGCIYSPQTKKIQGTVIIFHGNAGAAWHRSFYTSALMPLNYRVILAEYPGYGGRPGRPSEEALIRDAVQTVRLALEQYHEPLFLFGESLGCGVAAGIAADSSLPIAGLALLTPWDTLTDLAQRIYPFLPARILLRDQYDNITYLKQFTAPIAVVLADGDEIIPTCHGMRLFESLRSRRRLWVIRNAEHNTWFQQITAAQWREIMDFLNSGKR